MIGQHPDVDFLSVAPIRNNLQADEISGLTCKFMLARLCLAADCCRFV